MAVFLEKLRQLSGRNLRDGGDIAIGKVLEFAQGEPLAILGGQPLMRLLQQGAPGFAPHGGIDFRMIVRRALNFVVEAPGGRSSGGWRRLRCRADRRMTLPSRTGPAMVQTDS